MSISNDPMTLDPPGKIAVVGAGVLGIEAALYGRFLGYDVTLIEAESVGSSLRQCLDEPLPMLPARSLSPLAVSALEAQADEGGKMAMPQTYAQWLTQALVPLCETDLLAGRLRCPFRVTRISLSAVEADQDESAEELWEIPPDFSLSIEASDVPIVTEAVILAAGESPGIAIDFALPTAYFFQVGDIARGDPERNLHQGLRQIVDVYAELGGRADLDLYRPRRV